MIIGLQMTSVELTVRYFSTSFAILTMAHPSDNSKCYISPEEIFILFVAIFQPPQTWVTVFWNLSDSVLKLNTHSVRKVYTPWVQAATKFINYFRSIGVDRFADLHAKNDKTFYMTQVQYAKYYGLRMENS
jgi:hypothetical protein